MEQDISMMRGTSQSITLWLRHEDGTPYFLEDGWILRFGVKYDYREDCYKILKELTNVDQDDDGRCSFHISPSDTKRMRDERYKYDIGLQIGDDYYNIIEPSDFILEFSITSHDGGAK